MTVPGGDFASDDAGNFERDNIEDVYPIDVRIVGPEGGGALAPDFGSTGYYTVPVAGGNMLPLQILQRRPVREQAWIRNHDTANYVVISGEPQNLQQGIPQGFIIPPGIEEKIESQQPYYAVVMPAGTGLPGIVTSTPAVVTPATPATGVAVQNTNSFPVQVVIGANGATITAVVVNGVTVGTSAGTYVVPAYGAISISYTVATPTMVWTDVNTVVPAPVTVSVRDEAWAVRDGHDGKKAGTGSASNRWE